MSDFIWRLWVLNELNPEDATKIGSSELHDIYDIRLSIAASLACIYLVSTLALLVGIGSHTEQHMGTQRGQQESRLFYYSERVVDPRCQLLWI